jgi:hypothetical protein
LLRWPSGQASGRGRNHHVHAGALVRGGGKAGTGDADKSGGHDLAAMGAFADHGCIQSCLPAQRFSAHQNNSGPGIFWQRRACGLPARRRGCISPPYPLNWRGSSSPPWGTSISTKMGCHGARPVPMDVSTRPEGKTDLPRSGERMGEAVARRASRSGRVPDNRGYRLPFARNLQPGRRFNHASNLCFRFCP